MPKVPSVTSHRRRDARATRGFSLVEILVAAAVFLVFVTATAQSTVAITQNARHVANGERAAILAEEGIEVLRNLRDSAYDFDNVQNGTHGLSVSGGEWRLSGSSDEQGIFTREVTVSGTDDPNRREVHVLVSWADQASPENSVETSSYLTNWRAVLNVGAGLTVNKVVVKHGGSKTVDDFGPYQVTTTVMVGDPPEPSVVVTTVNPGEATVLSAGTYVVSENADPDYTRTFGGDCDSGGSVTLAEGGSATCTITNEEKPAKLRVTKTVINHGQEKTADDFTLLVDANAVVSGALNTFNSGAHTVSEALDPQYDATFGGDCAADGSVTLAPNTTKNCTVTNEEKLAYVVVSKTVVNDSGGTKTDADFAPYKVGGTTVTLGEATAIDSGTYAVSEAADPGYAQTFGGDCAADGSVTLVAGSTKTCSITNNDVAVAPSVTTASPVTGVTQTAATGGGNVTADGGDPVTARGVVWDTAANPTVALPTKTSDGAGTGSFSSAIAGLTCGTLYHVRAYATNGAGTAYGSNVTFTTDACDVAPTVTDPTAASITSSAATLGATVSSLGVPAAITARGVCYGTSPNPSLGGGATCVAAALSQAVPGTFTVPVSALTPGTLYHYRGYATNAAGTGYSAGATFTPASTVSFVAAAAVAGTTATIPARNVGDLLVAFAYRDGSNTAPTVPDGWTSIDATGGAANNSSVLAYRIATGVDSGDGWTNATAVAVHVYRGTAASPIGSEASRAGNGTTVTYLALAPSVADGSSWVVGFSGHRSVDTNLQVPPTGMSNRATFVNATAEVAGHDTGAGVASWADTSVAVGGSNGGWMTRTLEIKSQ